MRGRFPTILALFAAAAILLQPLACACVCLHASEVSTQAASTAEEPACPHCGGAAQPPECGATATHSERCPVSPCPCCAEKHSQVEVVLAAKVQPAGEDTVAGFQILPLPLLHLHIADPAVDFLSHSQATLHSQGALRALLCCWLI